MFRPVPGNVRFPQLEEEVLEFWRSHQIYEQSLERRQNAPPFVFYEGPPTANGLPHPGHCLTRAIKDLFPRYRTMRGYLCQRKAGWDTHGLPVEVEVCKELGIHSKEEIENYGVEPFIQVCQKSVWRYMKEWERLTERLGFWIHLDDAYVTYHQSYVESVWWSLKNLFQRGLLYQGHKIVWWWAQGGTALSSGEVGQGYREVADPSVYVRFPLVDRENTSLLVWTTTPWTLPSNQFSAVHPKIEYALAVDEETGEKLILAAELVDAVAEKAKRMLKVESTFPGTKVVGERYTPPFDYYYKSLGDKKGRLKSGDEQHLAWRVTTADFVTTESGTGVVHEAPAFGEVDFKLLQDEQQRFADNEGPQLLCAVAPDGTFTEEAPDYQGRWVKESDKDICRELRSRGLLYHQEQYLHEYPFCWRADKDPLIQYPRRGWFIRTTEFKERMLANNRQVNWLPDHIRDGRFGNFLETNVDWALSRERFWGTPLPIWACSETGKMEAVAHYDELMSKPGVAGVEVWQQAKQAHPELPEDLKVHKPYIDAVTYDSPFAEGARMQRVPEVIDCWYDSGAMPFAQWGNPQTNRASFDEQFPADFISEALDQTRGWFYSLLAISTLLYGDEQANQPAAKTALDTALAHEFPHPFRTCIVLGLMLAESHVCLKCEHRLLGEVKKCEKCGGKVARRVEKMSKRLRNYREPAEIFDRYGADALRWYFFANQPPWSSIIYSERAIKDSIPEFLLRLWNVYSFFTIYAEIDEFEPEKQLDGFDSESVGKQASELNAAMLQQAATYRPVKQRAELDRWVLSELNQTAAIVTEKMDAYDNFGACQALSEFVDGLSNWFVRRSRDRFWAADKTSPEKLDAYWTLYECLLTTSKMIAPFTPFLAETMWRNLAGVFGDRAEPSVHLCTYPTGEPSVVDEQLSQRMRLLREVVSLALRVRQENKLRVRQPLAKTEVVLANAEHQTWLEEHDALVRDEINVKQVEYIQQAEQYIEYQVRPNFKLLGPKLGKKLPLVKAALEQTDGAKLLAQMNASGSVTIDVGGEAITLDAESLEVRLHAKPGWAAAQGGASVVVLSTELTDELIREGLARDVVRHIQERRKELQCNYTDRIELAVVTSSAELRHAIDENQQYIRGETLAVSFSFDALPNVDGVEVTVSGHTAGLYVTVGE